MNRKFTLLVILVNLFFYFNSSAQSIDSISVKLTKVSQSTGPFEFESQTIDSFAAGLQLYSLQRLWGNNSWVNSRLYSFVYSTGILSEKTLQLWDTSHWTNNKKWIYHLSPSVDSTIVQKWNGFWENDSLTLSYHDSRNLDSLVIVKQWLNSNWVNYSKTENTFSPDSTYLSQYTSHWDDFQMQWNFINNTMWLNDSLQNDTAIIQQDFISGVWENTFMTYFQYDSLGQITFSRFAAWYDADSAFDEVYYEAFYTYDSVGHLTFLYTDGIPGGFSNQVLSYDSQGNLIDSLFHYETMGGIETDYNTHWYNFTFPSSPDLFVFVNSDYSICSTDSVPIGAFAFGGNYPLHYSWTPSTGLITNTDENPIVIADTTTNYILTVTDNNGNSDFEAVNINVFTNPEITSHQSVNTTCIGCHDGLIVLSVSGTNFYDIIINPDPGAIFVNNTIINLPAGIYTVCAHAQGLYQCNSCIIDTVSDGNIGVPEFIKENIYLSPNPFNSFTEIHFDNPGENSSMDLMDNLGRLIKTIPIKSSVTKFSGEDLSPGTYYGIIREGNAIVGRVKLICFN